MLRMFQDRPQDPRDASNLEFDKGRGAYPEVCGLGGLARLCERCLVATLLL